jgi:hypothetical protein
MGELVRQQADGFRLALRVTGTQQDAVPNGKRIGVSSRGDPVDRWTMVNTHMGRIDSKQRTQESPGRLWQGRCGRLRNTNLLSTTHRCFPGCKARIWRACLPVT